MSSIFKFTFKLILLIFVLHAKLSLADVDQLTASVDKNSILLDESIRLTVVASGSADKNAIDFSKLSNNFSLSTPSFSQSTQIINGDMTRTVSWSLNLYPKQIGTFDIPSFEVNGKRSQPFKVNVLPITSANTNQPREFFVTSEIDAQNIFLQQQILYTVKIHLSRDIERGQLSMPQLQGAVIEQIGDDKDYQQILNGVRYRIIERKYAVIPQASGNFLIQGPIFEAEVLTNSRRSFANFGRTQRITRRAPDIDIEVQPIPSNYSFTWLPSEFVEVTEEWQGDEDNLVAGEPITRTITLTALGLTKEQLPNIEMPYHPSFKVYPEQPKLTTVERNNDLIAQGVYNSAIIPSESGSFVLPELRIPWFNVKTGNTEFAYIPAKTIQVKPSVIANTQAPSNQIDAELQPSDQLSVSAESDGDNDYIYYIYLLISTNILTLVALYVIWLSKANFRTADSDHPENLNHYTIDENSAFNTLKSALEQGRLDTFDKDINLWLQALLGDKHYSVSSSLSRFPSSRALPHYNEVLIQRYGSGDSDINYRSLIKALADLRAEAKNTQSTPAINQLYPIG